MAERADLELVELGVRAWNRAWDPGSRKISRMEPSSDPKLLFEPKDWQTVEGERSRDPDLSGADLSNRNLAGINLQAANLQGANFEGTNLYGANLWSANISKANLRGATLDHVTSGDAVLAECDLRGASIAGSMFARASFDRASLVDANCFSSRFIDTDLSRADLSGAHLVSAQFVDVLFDGTCVSKATFGDNVFGECTITNIIGLDDCEYRFRSYLDPVTVALSGVLPLEFYRGCGWPDVLIRTVPMMVSGKRELTSCFISYATPDEELARRLHADLNAKGIRCWFAPEDLKTGERFRTRIDQSISQQEHLLLILSKSSMRSRWVEKEVETALELEATQNRSILLPIRIDDEVLDAREGWAADIRRTRHIGDFRAWRTEADYKRAFERLVADLLRQVAA